MGSRQSGPTVFLVQFSSNMLQGKDEKSYLRQTDAVKPRLSGFRGITILLAIKRGCLKSGIF